MNVRLRACLALAALALLPLAAAAQSTAFHYSGQLEADGVALNGFYDFIFTLTTAGPPPDPATAPALPWSGMEPLTRLRVPVSNGTFTVTLDYGPVPFDGMDLVIGIQVRTNFVPEMVPNPPPGPPYTELLPPVPVPTVPYAIRARQAGTAFTVTGPVPESSIPAGIPRLAGGSQNFSGPMQLPNPANTIVGTLAGDGAGVRNVPLGGIDSGGALSLRDAPFLPLSTSLMPTNFFYAVGDFNGDGRIDLAGWGPQAQILISTNNGSGGFVAAFSVADAGEFVVGDFNGDGLADLAVQNRCYTNRAGNALIPAPPSGGSVDGSGLVADIDADGHLDVVAAGPLHNNWDGKHNSGEVIIVDGQPIPSQGVPGFNGLTNLGCNFPALLCRARALGDFNGDGFPDLIGLRCGSNAFVMATNRGARSKCPWSNAPAGLVQVPLGLFPRDLKVADVNGDGRPDVLVLLASPLLTTNVFPLGGGIQRTSVYEHAILASWLNNGQGGFLPAWESGLLTNVAAIEVGDLNKDGYPDVATLLTTGRQDPIDAPHRVGVQVFTGDRSGGFSASSFSSFDGNPVVSSTSPGRLVVADLNGDGLNDVMVCGWGVALATPPQIAFHRAVNFGADAGPPFNVSSTTRVDNLNAALLDGWSASAFVLKAGDTMTGPLTAPAFAGDGGGLTGLNAGHVTSGSLADARLSSNIARRGGVNAFTSSNTFSGVVTALHPANRFAGDGAGLTNLAASNLVGSIPGVLVSNIPATHLTGTLPGPALAGTYGNALALSNAANVLAGDGSGLTSLNAGQVTAGTLADARLGSNIARRGGANAFTGANTFSGTVTALNPLNQFAGDGAGLTNLAASNLVGYVTGTQLTNVPAGQLVGTVPGSVLAGIYGNVLQLSNAANVLAGDGSAITGLSAANVSAGTLPLTRGGTGATTPANARANLNAAIRGANSDITSLSGLTTPLSVSQGGTGAGTPAGALASLGGAALSGLNFFPGTNHLTNAANVLGGDGSRLTALNPAALSGPVPASRGGLGFDSSGTSTGALLRATGLGAWESLAPGAEGNVLRMTAGVPAWGAEPGYAAGAGLQLSGGTFAVNFGGNGSANTVSRSDHTHDAAHLTSGLLPDERLGGTYTSFLNFNNPANVFAGSASALTDLNASALALGTLPNARLAGTYSSAVTFTHAGNSFSGSGAGLTGLNANQLTTGTVPESRLPPSVALVNLNQAYSGIPLFNGGVSGSTPPFSVDSTTLVPNLNADLLDGLDASAFAAAAHHHDNAYWKRTGNAGTVPGTDFLGTADNQALEFKVNGLRALRLEPASSDSINVIGGWRVNQVAAGVVGATIAGGGAGSYLGATVTNKVLANFGTVGGGGHNAIYAYMGVIGGGEGNIISNNWGQIGGGYRNAIMAGSAAIGGGEQNVASGAASVVGGGSSNVAGDDYATVAGGWLNKALGSYAVVPGGTGNQATNYALAAGRNARATNDGAFVWADATGGVLSSTNNNSMTLRAAGGFRLFTDSGATTGARLAAGGGSWTSMSDRNAKENFAPVNPREILDKVAALPVQNWNYRSQPAETRHIGPTAQDFKAAFGVGESDTGITAVDADGVALAAIQGLNQKLEEERRQSAARLERLEAENAGLRQALRELTERLDRSVPGMR